MDCDIAILQLTDPIRNTKPLAMVKESECQATHSHSALLLAGYQQDRPYMLSLDARCRLVKWVGKGVFLHDCDGVKGASGAPLISRQGGKFMIVGVHLGFIEPTASLSEAGVGTAWPPRSPG
jgi:protease YdgD